jgi:REP element-mobilizing transposase RayT
MRRLKVKGREGLYHCYSRIVGRERLLDARCREVLRIQIRRVSEFCGVEVLAWCVMSNHFHVLVRVPGESAMGLGNAELLRRYGVLYPKPTRWQLLRREVLQKQLEAGGKEGELARGKLCARMHDLSQYMKTLKQRYSVWYNRTHGLNGDVVERALWEHPGGGPGPGAADRQRVY